MLVVRIWYQIKTMSLCWSFLFVLTNSLLNKVLKKWLLIKNASALPVQNTPPWEKWGLLLRRTWKISLYGVSGKQDILEKKLMGNVIFRSSKMVYRGGKSFIFAFGSDGCRIFGPKINRIWDNQYPCPLMGSLEWVFRNCQISHKVTNKILGCDGEKLIRCMNQLFCWLEKLRGVEALTSGTFIIVGIFAMQKWSCFHLRVLQVTFW